MSTTRMSTIKAGPMQAQPPAVHHAPLEIAPETFLIQQLHGEGMAPVSVNVNSLVIRGAEPVIVDTGLFDASTGVYWASDAFATPVPAFVEDVSELDPGFWAEGFTQFQGMLSPWLGIVDADRWYAQDLAKMVDDPDLRTIVAAHTPPITGAKVGEALELMSRMPAAAPARLPEQADLDGMLAAMNAMVA